jgi:hypothetical protein
VVRTSEGRCSSADCAAGFAIIHLPGQHEQADEIILM